MLNLFYDYIVYAPRPGFEPGTYRLHITLNFRCGVDYLITVSPTDVGIGRFGYE
ncbi:MAG: hypothetical protein ACOX6V_05905 [Patescibacteria group bacterium]